jgi:hypothetical protein
MLCERQKTCKSVAPSLSLCFFLLPFKHCWQLTLDTFFHANVEKLQYRANRARNAGRLSRSYPRQGPPFTKLSKTKAAFHGRIGDKGRPSPSCPRPRPPLPEIAQDQSCPSPSCPRSRPPLPEIAQDQSRLVLKVIPPLKLAHFKIRTELNE